MRSLRLLAVAVSPTLAFACATIVGFPDVPNVDDNGPHDGGATDDGAGTGHDATSDRGAGDGGGPLDAATDGQGGSSCAPGGDGLTNCGPSRESCCTSTEVTGATYDRTYTNLGDGATGRADPAAVSNFRLDVFEVTVGRFRQFVRAWNGGAGYAPPPGSGKHTHLNMGSGLVNAADEAGITYENGWVASDDVNIAPTDANLACDPSYATWTAAPLDDEPLPINCVNWWEAYAFCIWDGGFLPSEAEWEFAAAGGAQQREYPWGVSAPGTADHYAIYGCNYPTGTDACSGVVNIAAVGTTLAAGRFSQLDLAGNIGEWNADWDSTSYVDPCTDCAYLASASQGRVVRGGDFESVLSTLLPPHRAGSAPSGRSTFVGVRCARTP